MPDSSPVGQSGDRVTTAEKVVATAQRAFDAMPTTYTAAMLETAKRRLYLAQIDARQEARRGI